MGDALPQTPPGITVSVADKVDSLVGLIGAGCAPTASADPSGLRRIANGLLQVMLCTTVMSVSSVVYKLRVTFCQACLGHSLGVPNTAFLCFSGCNPSLLET